METIKDDKTTPLTLILRKFSEGRLETTSEALNLLSTLTRLMIARCGDASIALSARGTVGREILVGVLCVLLRVVFFLCVSSQTIR